mmetsp:Transcript_33306/g.78989  ORF Transcript_33306/g.78989 Transcript_33306/m.78989 type:complete len:271 (+) Transcript_33306:54-866(+)
MEGKGRGGRRGLREDGLPSRPMGRGKWRGEERGKGGSLARAGGSGEAVDEDGDTRAHGGGHVRPQEVPRSARALELGGAGGEKRRRQHPGVVGEALEGEVHLADRNVDDAPLVGAELDAAALHVCDRLWEPRGLDNGAELGVGHKAAWAEDAGDLPKGLHRRRGGDALVEAHLAAAACLLDMLHEVLSTSHVRSRRKSPFNLLRLRKHRHPDLATGPVREAHAAADHLVSAARVYAEVDSKFHCFHKLPLVLFCFFLDTKKHFSSRFNKI